ncbi:hypothetical protein [Sutcliffiella horikoshii]|uniref:hypothetical protein n=1 Tax=Sutcliffiella horikoshii TaxID=79883 RepID=UPI00385075FA
MGMLSVLLTIIQFGILFYLAYKVKIISSILEEQQVENNKMLVALKKLKEVNEKKD